MSVNLAQETTERAERLTWTEICQRFPDEWVVVADADWVNDRDFEFATAVVLGHRRHRKDASGDVKLARPLHTEVGCFWTGEIRGPVPRFLMP